MANDSLHFFCARNDRWLFCLGVSIAAFALTCWPQGLPLFRYDRTAIACSQLWRLASAHLVHLNTAHLLLNLGGLLLICELLWNRLAMRHGIGLIASSALGISGLLWWRHPDMAWYAGLSGALHGLWAGCALTMCMPLTNTVTRDKQTCASDPCGGNGRRPISRWIGLGGLLFLLVKLILETIHGAPPDLAEMIGAPVAGIAHTYGALIGCAYVLAWHGGGLLVQTFTRRGVFD